MKKVSLSFGFRHSFVIRASTFIIPPFSIKFTAYYPSFMGVRKAVKNKDYHQVALV